MAPNLAKMRARRDMTRTSLGGSRIRWIARASEATDRSPPEEVDSMIDLVKAFDGTTQILRAVREALAIAHTPPTKPEERRERALLETDVLLTEDTPGIDETDRKYARRWLEGDLRSLTSRVLTYVRSVGPRVAADFRVGAPRVISRSGEYCGPLRTRSF
jgi:hypothetical protein